jgi:hypothetical protein
MSPELRATGRTARLAIAFQVLLAAVLAGAAVVLVTWLAERPGLRARVDLTGSRENTLAPASLSVLAKLQSPVEIDVFFTAMPGPVGPIGYETQERTLRLLAGLHAVSGGRVDIRPFDMTTSSGIAVAETRLKELSIRQVEPGGIVVVSMGRRNSLLHLSGDLADIDPGDPRGEQGAARPARLVRFRAEESIVSALLKVGLGDTLRALFTTGHGELDLEDASPSGLSDLRSALEGDGFSIGTWSGAQGGRIPDDCAVLAVVGPEQPFSAEEARAIAEFVEEGGRLVAAPGLANAAGESSLPALLSAFGIRIVVDGIVAEPRANLGRPLVGTPECALIRIDPDGLSPSSPVTEPLKRSGRYALMPFSMSLEPSPPPTGGSLVSLLTTGDAAWRDLPDSPPPSGHDWKKVPSEGRGPFVVGMTSLFRPPRLQSARRVGSGESQPEGRVLCLGSAVAFSNQCHEANSDLLLNAFDWAVSREYLVHVEPRNRTARRLNVSAGPVRLRVYLATALLLPGSCLLLGLFTWWRRRRP